MGFCVRAHDLGIDDSAGIWLKLICPLLLLGEQFLPPLFYLLHSSQTSYNWGGGEHLGGPQRPFLS